MQNNSNMFVGNLHFSTTGDALRQIFSRFGEVLEAKVIYTSNEKGHKVHRGYGFVRMSNSQEALTAREKIDGSYIDSRRIKIKDAFYKNNRAE